MSDRSANAVMQITRTLKVLLLLTLIFHVASANAPNITELAKGVYPLWSPLGDRVAYSAPNGLLAVIDSEGKTSSTIAQYNGSPRVETWSPDGQKIIVTAPGQEGLVLINLNDGTQEKFIRNGNASAARWSPDGKHIAYLTFAENRTQVWVINPAGTSNRQVLEIGRKDYEVVDMEWSPDSEKIAVSSSITWILDLRTLAKTIVSNSTVSSSFGRGTVAWSPTGQSFYLTDRRFERPDIVELTLAGDVRARLTNDDSAEIQLSLDRSGKKLAYLNITPGNYSNREAPNSSIWVLDVSTGERFQVHPPGGIQIPLGYIHRLHLHPSANKILFAQEAADIMILDFSPTQVPGKFVESPGVSSGQTPPKQTPGFEAVAAVAAILLVAYLRGGRRLR